MTDLLFEQPTATTYSVAKLVKEVRAGRMRIPNFQRKLRWKWKDVQRLFDSIVRGYPIGSLLLWSRPAEAASLSIGALSIEAPSFDKALWVVDGQQRITSLASGLSEAGLNDPRFALAYDLGQRTFERPRDRDPLRVPLPVLFDLQRLLKWLAEHPETAEHFDEATRVASAIHKYTIPAYVVEQEDEAVLRDIFDRMNTFGKPLSRAEVFSALYSSGPSGGRALSDISENLDARFGFGPIDEDTLLRAMLARRGPDVTREIRSEFDGARVSREFPEETSEEANQETERSLERVLSFLQEEAGVPHFGFLPYRYLLVVLARFFAHHPKPSSRNRDLLRRWFWRAAIIGPAIARGAYTSTMRSLAACITKEDESGSVQRLLGAVSSFELSYSLPKFKSTAAETRFALCALWSLQPRSTLTGRPHTRADLAQALVGQRTASRALGLVFPKTEQASSRAGNRVFLLGDDTLEEMRQHLEGQPAGRNEEEWCKGLESHAFTKEMSHSVTDPSAFLDMRDRRIEEITRAFLERMTESELEDTPPLEELELDDDWPLDDAVA